MVMTVLERWMKENKKRGVDLASTTGLAEKTINRVLDGETVHHSTLTAISRETGIPPERIQLPSEDAQGVGVG